jgi:hypothetical protein
VFQAHAYIISSLYKEMPTLFGKDTKKIELISNLQQIYSQLEHKYLISPGDFPELKRMQASVSALNEKHTCCLGQVLCTAVCDSYECRRVPGNWT